MRRLETRRVLVVTDPRMASSEAVAVTLESLRDEGVDAVLFDRVSVEPTDVSFKEAIAFATEGNFDGYVAVGGGSSIDTAKAANLYATWPADFPGVRERAYRRREARTGSAEAADRDTDHFGNGQRDDRCCDIRLP